MAKKNKTVNLSAEQAAITALETQLAEKRAALVEQEKQLAIEMKAKVDGIPAMLGVTDIASAIKLIRKIGKPVSSGRKSKVTPETEARVIALVKEGKTGEEIAKEVKLSVPTVHKIKKANGLVKARV